MSWPILTHAKILIAAGVLFFYRPAHHRDLHSFPTRRSSDLRGPARAPSTGSPCSPASSTSWSEPCTPGTCGDRKSTRLNSSHPSISYAVFCLKKKKNSRRVTLSPCDPRQHHLYAQYHANIPA